MMMMMTGLIFRVADLIRLFFCIMYRSSFILETHTIKLQSKEGA
jgi:hypothetical protein